MASPIVAGPNLVDASPLYTPSFSGGAWGGGALTNLADPDLDAVARSTTDAVADTQFTVDLGVARAVKLLALPKHNLSSVGTIRVRGFTAVPVVDSLDFGTGWSAVNTPTRSAAAFTCDDGVPLDLIGDNDGANAEYYERNVVWTGDGQKVVAIRVKEGASPAAAGGRVFIRDTTASADRLSIAIAWTAGVPSFTQTTGTVLSSTAMGSGVYRVVMLSTSLTAANTNSLRFLPAASAAQQGDMYAGDVLTWNAATDQLAHDTGFGLGIASGIDANEAEGLSIAWYRVLSTAATARYWRFNFNDTTNADGYVQLHRLFIASGFQPTVGVEYGAELSIDDDSESLRTEGGADFHIERNRRRTATGWFPEMPESDELIWRQLLKRVGKTGQVFYVHDPDDTTLAHERAFLGCFTHLPPISFPTYARSRAGYAIRETL